MASVDELVGAAQTLPPAERLRLIERLWQTMPAASWRAFTDSELGEANQRLNTSDANQFEAVPWPAVQRLLADCIRSTRPKTYSVPRRFDLATILIVTVAYSLLLGTMSLVQFPAAASLAVAGFITIVGIGQALLFGGRRPRTASIFVGTTICTASLLIYWSITGQRMYSTVTLLVIAGSTIVSGAVLGYIAGACVGGVFLCADLLRGKFQMFSCSDDDD